VTAVARVLAAIQLVLAVRVFARMVSTARGSRIERAGAGNLKVGQVTVIVPVLDEVDRLSPCLAGLIEQGPEVGEILVVDGGSTDGTPDLVGRWSARDPRIRLIDASPAPAGVNGKAHNLQAGLQHAGASPWVLTIDADVRPARGSVSALLAHASRERVPALSAATRQRLSGAAEALVHPAMLTTLVYRFGIPGGATTDPEQVQANGQCFLVRRDVLDDAGGFARVLDSVCEDVTLARNIAQRGHRVGFYEAGDLVQVEMYAGWRDAWQNWSRSLPMRDRHSGLAGRIGLAEVLLVQAAPPWLAAWWASRLGRREPAAMLNAALAVARLGVLGGTARAYVFVPPTYWLSPLADVPVALRLIAMWRRRRHRWRGRDFISGDTA
jgi:dolichol-phosphate mannosyltransferase